MRRSLIAVATAMLGVFGLAQPAAAVEPTHEHFSFTGETVVPDICAFPITVGFSLTVTLTSFFDQAGNLTRVEEHAVEQDTFTANDKTLSRASLHL